MELIIYSSNLEVYINDSIVLVDYFIDQVLHIYSRLNISEIFLILIEILIILIGLIFGSFANVCIHRLPLDLDIVKGRSHCPKCKKKLFGTTIYHYYPL